MVTLNFVLSLGTLILSTSSYIKQTKIQFRDNLGTTVNYGRYRRCHAYYKSWLPTFGVRIDVKPVSKFLEIDCFDHRKEQCLINENMKCSLVLKLFTLTNSHCLVKLRKNAIFITSVNTLEKLTLAFRVEKVTVIPFDLVIIITI